jgi:hypothetical protein
MLDFYLLPDNHAKPNSPEQAGLKLIGQLDSKTFEQLIIKKIIADRFDYYADFRWDTLLIKRIYRNIQQKQLQTDTDVKQLLAILDIAEKEHCGLVAYGD